MADETNTNPTTGGPPQDPLLNGTAPRALPFVIAIPNIRNGALVNIAQAAPKAAMSALYHWPVVAGASHEHAVRLVEYLIRAAYAQLLHVTGGAPTAAQLEEMRKKAIVLGAIRAGAAAALRIGQADVTASEVVPSGMRYNEVRNEIGQDAAGATAAGRWTVAQGMTALSATEDGAIAACVYMGMAVPVLQGVSLVMTAHHYIPTTYNLFKGIKKQAMAAASQEVAAWVDAMGESFDDMAFHKACHPISPTLKREFAKSVDVAHRLRASGHGAAAIRLPAIPSDATGGKAAIALFAAAAGTIKAGGHSITWDDGAGLMMALEQSGAGPQEAAACDEVVKWVSANSEAIAFCAGIVQHVHDTTGSGRNTILSAFSIRRIMAERQADVSRGIMYARAVTARMRTAMEGGVFPDPQIHI